MSQPDHQSVRLYKPLTFSEQFERDVPDIGFVRGIHIDKARIRTRPLQRASFVSIVHLADNFDIQAKMGSVAYRFPIDEVLSVARERMGDDFQSLSIVLSGRAAFELARRSRLAELFGDRGIVLRRATSLNNADPLRLMGYDFNK